MTYRQAPIREPIEPPWGRHRGLGRKFAYSLFGAGGLGALALFAVGDPVLAIAAALSSSGIGLSFLFGGGGQPPDVGARDPNGPEEPLRRAGLQPVGWTEWRADREGFPVRILYSALSAKVRIEVALGTAPPLALEIEAPPGVEPAGEVIGPVRLRSDQIDIARTIVAAALRRVSQLPPTFTTRLHGRVLQCWTDRGLAASGYEMVIAALDLSLGIAQAMASMGMGLAPFRKA